MPFELMEPHEAIRDVSNYQLQELVKAIKAKGLIKSLTMKVVPQWEKLEDQAEFEKLGTDNEALEYIKGKNIKCLIMAGNHRYLVCI